MKALSRFFIVIWLIIFIPFCFVGGFIIIPIVKYIFWGKFDEDLGEDIFGTFLVVKNYIENCFNKLSNIKCKINDKFWK